MKSPECEWVNEPISFSLLTTLLPHTVQMNTAYTRIVVIRRMVRYHLPTRDCGQSVLPSIDRQGNYNQVKDAYLSQYD